MEHRGIEERLADIDLPYLVPAISILGPGDALITCAGFEDRALAFLESTVRSGSKGFCLVGVDYRPRVDENRIDALRKFGYVAGARTEVQEYERQDPGSSSDILAPVEKVERIYIDISGMSRLLIVQLIAGCVRRNLLSKLHVIYTEAVTYPPTREEVQRTLDSGDDVLGVLNFISSGVFGIQIVTELSTVAMQGQPIRLIAFPSFNPTQLAAVFAEIQAASFTIVNGVPPMPSNMWRKDAIRRLNGIESIKDRDERDVSTIDYRETLRLVLDLYRLHSAEEKLVISPTGSKMQSVGVGLACGYLRDIQIVYPAPRSFPSPSNYTRGSASIHQLSFQSFASLSGHADVSGDAGEG